MKQHACLENCKLSHLSVAQGACGRNMGDETKQIRNRQVKSLGCKANGFELHPKIFGMSLYYFKQGRGILRSNLHFIIAVLAQQHWIKKC